jgi:hypothetical protein
MDLRELLLEFAGESGKSMELDELLTEKVRGVEVVEEINGGVRVLVKNPKYLEEIKDRIQEVLEKNGYKEYNIKPETDGEMWHILIEATK